MKARHIVSIILATGITTSVNAAKPGGGDPPAPQDVNVIILLGLGVLTSDTHLVLLLCYWC